MGQQDPRAQRETASPLLEIAISPTAPIFQMAAGCLLVALLLLPASPEGWRSR